MFMYARIVGGSVQGSPQVFYKLSYDADHLFRQHVGGEWRGPYRDKTDAENAAYDEAKVLKVELEWLD